MNRKVIPFSIRNRFVFCVDMCIIILVHFITLMIVTDYYAIIRIFGQNILPVAITCVVFGVCLFACGAYKTYWTFAGLPDYIRLVVSLGVASYISLLAEWFTRDKIRFLLCILAVGTSAGAILFVRIAIRGLDRLNRSFHRSGENTLRTLIVGAGEGGGILAREIQQNDKMPNKIVGFIDDDKDKKNQIICGYKVYGNVRSIPRIVKQEAIEEIIIAIPSMSAARSKEIIDICAATGCSVKLCPGLESLVDDKIGMGKVRKVEIEDLLGREPVKLDNDKIKADINGRVVCVTGGGGSIGSELCRQIMKHNPEKLVIIDIYENNAYELQMELNKKYPENMPEVIIASVRDSKRIEEIFNTYKPYIVFHAAAHKHVPLMEDSPGEAIKNNVFGTYNTAKCADKCGVKKFVLISTDKAVNPTNVMGATKRICEMIVQHLQAVSRTEFVAVRFGNVLGSNGSVIPLFKKQIREGGPLTVTHKEITRFFMTIPEAASLVLQAASYAKGGEIFVLDMGEPVKIYDLAINLIRLSGLVPGRDINIEVTGLRPGEKLYEELLMDEEGLTNTQHDKIFIGKPIPGDIHELEENLAFLKQAVEEADNEKIKDAVARVVPTYVREQKYSAVTA